MSAIPFKNYFPVIRLALSNQKLLQLYNSTNRYADTISKASAKESIDPNGRKMISEDYAPRLVVPQHLGLILDGNRRWADARGKTVMEGHRQGYRTLKTIVRSAINQGVGYVSAYVFSTENWNRTADEVKHIMKLVLWAFRHEIDQLNRDNIRVRVIGSKLKLGKALLRAIHEAEIQTADNKRGTLLLCLDYGGQQEIVDAAKRIAEQGVAAQDITADMISKFLYAPDVPPLDLIIRTSGEQRLSNFMLWEAAYSELVFSPTYWPDFDEAELVKTIGQYSARKRRFGS